MQIFNDTFATASTVDVTAHTSESGHSWLLAKGTPAPKVYTAGSGILANGATSSAAVIARTSVMLNTADIKLAMSMRYDSANFNAAGLTARMAADGNSGYLCAYIKASQKWGFWRLDANATATSMAELVASAAIPYAAGTSGIMVEFSVTGSGASVSLELKVGGVSVLTYSDTSASRVTAPGYFGAYFFNQNAGGSGAWFESLSADDIPAASDTTAPTMTGSLTSSGVTSSGYTIDWSGTTRSDNVGITSYETSTDNATWTDAGNVTSKTYTGLTASTLYPNYVRARDAAGNRSTPSLSLNVTTSAASGDTTLPVLAGSITPGGVTSSSIQISWPAGSDNVAVAGYEVSKDGGSNYTNVGNVLTATITGLAANTAHGIRVRVYDTAGNRSTPPLSATITTAAAVSAPAGLALKFADLVQDTTATVGTGSLTMSNSSVRALAAAYAVGTKRIPYCVQNETGTEWEVGNGTLTGATTFSRDEVSASSNSNAPVAFSAGTKTLSVVLSAKAISRLAVKDCIDLADYDVDPTFTNDSTAGIQAAINDAYTTGIGKIRVPVGRYKIAGPRVGSGNCQLYIPQTREATPNKSVYFEGVCPPNFQQQGLRNVAPPDNGCIFESTLIGAGVSGVNPAVIGGEQGHNDDAWKWNYTNFGMKNMGIRTAVAATGTANKMCAINAYYLSQVNELDMLRIDVNRGLQDMVEPNTGSYGIILPPRDNHLMINIGTVYISGYNNAVMFQEHTHIRNLISIGNVNGVVLQPAYHGSWIGMYSAEWTKNAFVINGNHDLTVGMYDAEHNSGARYTSELDIKYVTGNRKISITHCLIVKQSFGQDDTDWKTDATAANYKILVGAGAN